MTQNEYINILRRNLRNLSPEEINEIIADVKEHYIIGLDEGKTEEEISKLLGNPVEMGRQYSNDGTYVKEEYVEEEEYIYTKPHFTNNERQTFNVFIRILLIFVAVTMILPLIFSFYAVLFSCYAVGSALILTGIVSFISIFGLLATQITFLAGLLVGIGAIMAGVAVINLTTRGVKLLTRLLKEGFEWFKGGIGYGFV